MGILNIKNKKNKSKRDYSRYLVALAGLCFLVLISIPLAKNISQQHKIDSEIKDLEKEINSVEEKNDGLRKVMDYMSSDQFIEEQARLKFGLQKPGEQVAAVKNLENGDAIEQNSDDEGNSKYLVQNLDTGGKRNLSNPEKWYYYFLKTENIVK